MENQQKILIADDERIYRNELVELLRDGYQLDLADNGLQVLQRVEENTPDLILMDIDMPEMNGFQICQKLKNSPRWRHIPVIFMTADTGAEIECQIFDCGAADLITKPITPSTLKSRVKTQLTLKLAMQMIAEQTNSLERKIAERVREIEMVQDSAIHSLATLAEVRDRDTGSHVWRTQYYVKALANALRRYHRFSEYLTDETIDLLFKAAPLHDVGKIGVEDRVLKKQGKLTAEEYEVMKAHVIYGAKAIDQAIKIAGNSSFLQISREVIYYHHERWDGSGYPEGLKGDAIPISARIMAVCDVYDALVSKRSYKLESSHERAMHYISDEKGGHFDPDIVAAFISIAEQIQRIAAKFSDS